MNFIFKTIHEFNDYFKDEVTCYQYLEMMRWEGVAVCPHCASIKTPYNVKSRGMFKDMPSYRCSERSCNLPFTVRTNTVFEGSKVSMRKWLQACYELQVAKKGISSIELGERIGVSQKTAWFMNHRLREIFKDTDYNMLSGVIEADETFIGGKDANKHASKKVIRSKVSRTLDIKIPSKKSMVLGLLQRTGKIKTFVIQDRMSDTLFNIVKENVEPQSRVITDALSSYDDLKYLYKHEKIKPEFGNYITKGDKHTNSIEGFWSIIKRGIVGTFHSVSPKHLQRYCDEFTYRYNNRGSSLSYVFSEALKQVNMRRITYTALTAKISD